MPHTSRKTTTPNVHARTLHDRGLDGIHIEMLVQVGVKRPVQPGIANPGNLCAVVAALRETILPTDSACLDDA